MSDSFDQLASDISLDSNRLMAQIDNKRYACAACIRGHRSSNCTHTDRPQLEIKRKGRPTTQCEHCRELRKTKQVYVRCQCESQERVTGHPSLVPSSSMKANPAFPDRLPKDLEASIALSEGLSDSDRGPSWISVFNLLLTWPGERSLAHPCTCKKDGVCHCSTPRKRPARRKTGHRLSNEELDETTISEKSQIAHSSSSSLPSSQVLARIAPRPSNQYMNLAHDPSNAPHSHVIGHHTRSNMVSSSYSHAYDISYGHNNNLVPETEHFVQAFPQNISSLPQSSTLRNPLISDLLTDIESLQAEPSSFPSTCQCGKGCTCPGCKEHSSDLDDSTTSPPTAALPGCANPGACSHCLDCTVLSLPTSVPPDTALSELEANQAQSIDEWMHQLSILSSTAAGLRSVASLPPNFAMAQAYPPWAWDTIELPQFSEPNSSTMSVPEHEEHESREISW